MPSALIRGGGQEKGHRSGTENPVAIAGFGVAAEIAANGIEERMAGISAKRDRLEAAMLAAAPDVLIHGKGRERIGNTSFFTLPGLKAETGQMILKCRIGAHGGARGASGCMRWAD